MNAIGSRLKELREKNNLTRKEVAGKLKALGIDISDKTLYGYESGRNSANADMFLALCKIYNCNNITDTFSDTVDDVLFANNEWEHLEKYRLISQNDAEGKALVDSIVNYLCGRIKAIQEKGERGLMSKNPDYHETEGENLTHVSNHILKGSYQIPKETEQANPGTPHKLH